MKLPDRPFRAAVVLAATGLFTLAACKQDPIATTESATLELDLRAVVATEPLALEAETYTSPAAAEGYRVSRFSFYLSDLQLVQSDGNLSLGTELSEVAYVQFGPDGRDVLTLPNVPVGRYDALRFRIGLTDELDATVPADYADEHPLGRDSEYWVDWGSYIFLKVEGRSDTLADGRARFDAGFVYHVGRSAELAREVTIPLADFEVAEAGARLELDVDFAEVIGAASGDPLPLKRVADHQNVLGRRVVDNLAGAVTRRGN